ncbi:hypothetical protein L2E82_19346 [Cichorium intybus]|uniref:Uncharacterized protein n=1 Tax=Cichorium intybus TaxID=13427 RepID=A0ACB9FCP6_CICIN|nr:hypothetical protein L2E82_19346 [Cichorium intybus]
MRTWKKDGLRSSNNHSNNGTEVGDLHEEHHSNNHRKVSKDDPYNHLYEFLVIANANTPRNTNSDIFRLRLFPFTLKEKAKYWFTSLPPNSITTWDQLKVKFLQEFYPARMNETHQAMKNALSSGTFMWQEPEDAWRFLEQLSLGSKSGARIFHNTPRPFRNNQQREVRQPPMRQQHVQPALPAGNMNIGMQEIFGMLVKLQEVEDANSQAKLGEFLIKLEKDRELEKSQPPKVQVNEVITLRSGKKVDNKKREKEGQVQKKKKPASTWEKGETSGTAPFPAALEKPERRPYRKKGPQAEDIWDLFSQIKVNIPLVKLIKEVPAYAKFLKDMCIHKKHILSHLPKRINLPENVSSIIMNTLPSKLKDPGVPLVLVDLGNVHIKKALLDLGASVNILLGQLFDKYEFGTLRPTDVILQLADKSTKIPRGMLSDVIIKVRDFYYPTDFLVLDTRQAANREQPTIILGRPFLATANANIDCRTGEMGISFGHWQTKINIFNAKGSTMEDEECYQVDIIDELVQQYTPEVLQQEVMDIQEE